MKRFLDLAISMILLVLLGIPMLLIGLAVKLSSHGPILYWSDRVGRGNHLFRMPKFRTMRGNTPQVATHLLDDPEAYLTPIGSFLRSSSLDELPQLFSVIRGDLSLVGPRPALFNQDDLIAQRTKLGIHLIRPGITGWAQVNGRDDLPVPVKVQYDYEYLSFRSFCFDMKILFLTVFKVLMHDGVSH